MQAITYHPIGVIHSPFTEPAGMPIQPGGTAAAPGTVELLPEFSAGLADLEGFTHLILLYHFHRVQRVQLTITPFLDDRPHGVFATRAPTRPNPIGLSVVRLLRRDDNILYIANLDVVDGTPLLDVKPYVPQFDAAPDARAGWLAQSGADMKGKRADDRFA
jgi:tRNA-Thr(GGU) m(6)t(6)A37 methyltransferase TsaA